MRLLVHRGLYERIPIYRAVRTFKNGKKQTDIVTRSKKYKKILSYVSRTH